VTSLLYDLFFTILLIFVLGLYSTYERKHAVFGLLNLVFVVFLILTLSLLEKLRRERLHLKKSTQNVNSGKDVSVQVIIRILGDVLKIWYFSQVVYNLFEYNYILESTSSAI
jgi:prolipoprotein diacylglyceryltransferase